MRWLTVFVQPNGRSQKYLERLARCFPEIPTDIYFCNLDRVNDQPKKTPWYMFLYEGEILDKNLVKALPKILTLGTSPVYNLYKWQRDLRFFCTCRIYRSYIKLRAGSTLPESYKLLMCNNILDGWLRDV